MIPLSDRIKKNKLAISFMLILLIFISIGIFTIKGLYTLGDLTRRIYEHPLVVSNASLQAALDITKIHRDMKDVVLAIYPDEIKATLKAINGTEQKVYQHLDRVRNGSITSLLIKKFFTVTSGFFYTYQKFCHRFHYISHNGYRAFRFLFP